MAQSDTRYLKRQRQGWYFSLAMPQDLRGRFISEGRRGKKGHRHPGQPLSKIVVSLHTQSLREAQERRWPLVQEWRQKFERARTGALFALAEIDAFARESYAAALVTMNENAENPRFWEDLKYLKDSEQTGVPRDYNRLLSFYVARHRRRIERFGGLEPYLAQIHDFDKHGVAPDIARIEARTGVKLDRNSEIYRTLCSALLRSWYSALEGRLRAANGEPSEPPVTFLGAKGIDPVTLRPIAPPPRKPVRLHSAGGMTFSEAAARYIDELQRDQAAKISEQTRGQMEAVYRLFAQASDDPPLADIDRTMASEFLDEVGKLDPHWGRSPQTKDRTWKELQQRFGNGKGQLTNRTLNHYASALSRVFKWARKRGHFDGNNPFTDQGRRESDPKKVGWVPYSIAELNALFRAPLFDVQHDRIRPDKHTIETTLRWVPLVALYSGMRLGEICQLRTTDVRRDGKVWFFNVSEETEGQSVKTEAAIRRVPIHSMLVECGFMDYLKGLPAGSIWPALKPGGPDGKLSWYLSKRFTEFRRGIGIDRPRLSFHSLRKNFATALDNAGATRDDIAALIGHERGFTLETYSGGKGLKALRDIMQRVKYPGLRFNHLYV